MANAAEDTPKKPAIPDEPGPELDRDIAGTMAAFRALARLADRRGARDPEDQAQIAALERRLGDLAHATAQHREALVPRVAALEAREAETYRELEAIRQEVRHRGRFRFVHVAALGAAAVIFTAGALVPGGLTVAATVAGGIVSLVGRDVFRRRR